MGKQYDFARLEIPDRRVLEILMSKTVAERFRMANEANKTARALIAGYLKTTHPDWTESQVAAEVGRRILHGTA